MQDFTYVKVVRWSVLQLLLTFAGTQGALFLISDKQYAHLQGEITLTCNTSDNVSSIEFRRDDKYVGKCVISSCETSATKFIVNKNTEPVGYNIFTVTVKGFEVNDDGFYKCIDKESSQESGIQITHTVDITSVTLTPKKDPISVIENVPELFRCVTSTCRPAASVTWILGSTQLTSGIESITSQDVTTSTLNYTSQKKHQDMQIHCQGSNGGQLRKSDDRPRLNVLYGPRQLVCRFGGSSLLSAVAVREGQEFSLNCSSDGNPPPSFSWTHPGDGPSSSLFIGSINRTHAGIFRIIARNNLIPSNQQAVNLSRDINVTVDVQYEAKVTNITLSNVDDGQKFEANESSQVIFHCQAQGNPLSNVVLSKENHDLKTESNTNELAFTIIKSVCEDDGTYQCSAQNIHNTKADIRSLMLFVRCAPRASTLDPRKQNVTSATGVPAVLTLTLVAFPRPGVVDILWEKQLSALNTWHIVPNASHIEILISEDGLQTQLSFSSVMQDDFGYYRVHVNNELGNYNETFSLQKQGKMTEALDRLTNEHKLQSMSHTDGTEDDNDDEVINELYEGGDDVQDRTRKAAALQEQPHKKKAVSMSSGVGELYAVVNKKSKDEYENTENPRGANGVDNHVNHDVPLAKETAKENVNKDGLVYEELTFSNPTKEQQRIVIHGSDEITKYAEVDLTKTAKPLREKDEKKIKLPSK
ncbi:hemicentin-2-like isoform X2 [Mya arenaria]|uniref:hemicentin-2-like isoform X2 n=1 Tax=Mya arenaria TaxID=6604 RepID=UPI0022E44670|nr:hemicentin-2-like isoform X2 [Mya arenaria]